MKRIFTILVVLLLTVSVFAQAPEKMSYQAVIRNTSDQLVANQGIGMQISILQTTVTGTAVYVETHNTTTNINGLVSVELGNGVVVSGVFADIDWSSNVYFIKTETDPTTAGGETYTITGTSQLLSVAYALHAKTAESIEGGITESQNLSDILSLNNDGGSIQIKNIANPTDSQDVVTLSYLNASTQGLSDNDLVLWNKLGSEAEVLASEVGENGELVGTGHNYEAAEFENGYVRTNTSSYVKFPQTVLENCRSKGTIEFWVNPKVTNPKAYSYGAFMLVGHSIGGSDAFAFVRWGDGTTGLGISGGINFDGTIHKTPEESTQFVATIGTPFHISFVWDVTGIDGTAETIRLYRDGVVIGASTETWNDTATTTYDNFYIGTGPDGQGYDKYIMDNIKVWKYAKTDFTDIDNEHQTGLYTAGTGIDITNNVVSLDTAGFTSVGGTSSFKFNNDVAWHQFADLATTITLSEPGEVLITYNTSSHASFTSDGWFGTKLLIDGADIQGYRSFWFCEAPGEFFKNSASGIVSLASGTHTITVEYRTTSSLVPGDNNNYPASLWHEGRNLSVKVLR